MTSYVVGVDYDEKALRRLLAKVDVCGDDECWPWLASLGTPGYGQFSYRGRPIGAHRAAYLLLVGSIPEGHEIDHTCRNRLCVNPRHLEAVTGDENRRRQGAAVEVCVNGHDYTPETTGYHYNRRSGRRLRYCLVCHRERRAA